ncbi:exosortase B [Aquabacterium sp.]|uniref:exosortase B n=1 Tax=Aquabacterium sp. TaxID=1872578 RepID=UPI002489836D|nr:exosortase B [Aquabacterium sp.]MDI1259302.1 exosortase B [Aquabacterium sp.]
MTQATVTPTVPSSLSSANAPSFNMFELGLVLAGLLALYVPTYVILDKTIWNVVGQGHGPVILALMLWLIWQRWPKFVALSSAPANMAGAFTLTVGLLLYILGHSQDILFIDVGSQLLVLAGIFLLYRGWAGLRVMWFPLFFIIFMIPVPGSVVDQVTAPLKQAVSYTAEHVLYWAGYPIGRSGVVLTIGPYQLLVADACAGLNSIFALEAIGVFYMSVAQHTNQLRNSLLAVLILPISFASNVIRVVTLVLVTYYFGDAVGQGFVHDFAGIVLFMVATLLTIGTDSILGLFITEPKPPKNEASVA